METTGSAIHIIPEDVETTGSAVHIIPEHVETTGSAGQTLLLRKKKNQNMTWKVINNKIYIQREEEEEEHYVY